MKKIISTLIVVCAIATASNAQYRSVLVYGNAGVGSNKNAAGTKTFNGSFNPGVGYQFSNELTAGLNLGIGSSSITPMGGTAAKISNLSFGPFVRYTKVLSNMFGVFGQANVGINSNRAAGTATGSGVYANIQPSAYVNLKNGFALNFTFGSLGFGTQKATGATTSSSGFGLDFGTGAGFGISKNFAAKLKR
jgi:hypothetical protein